MIDKGAKIAVGLARASSEGCDRAMIVDADDFVDHRIASLVTSLPPDHGVFSPAGYYYLEGTRSISYCSEGFHLKNGSSRILPIEPPGIPRLPQGLTREDVEELLGRRTLLTLLGQHAPFEREMRHLGVPVRESPFPLAVSQIGTGDNFSERAFFGGERLQLTRELRTRFGMPLPSRWTDATSRLRNLGLRLGVRARRIRGGSG